MSDIAAQPGDVIDFSLAEMPVKIEDRSFDTKMVPELITYLKDIRDHSLDYVVPGSKMEVKPVGGSNWELWIDSPETTDFYQEEVGGQIISKVLPAVKIFKPTNWAMSQTVGKTPMPKRYHDTLLGAGKSELAALNLNEWLHEQDKVMVRTVGDKFRAMVSDRYRAFDNLDLFSQTAQAVKNVNDSRQSINPDYQPVQFWKADATETTLFVSILDKGQEYDIGKGDKFNVMLTVKNSEVGKSSMSIEPSFFRGMCLNLYSREPDLRKVHSGEKLDSGIFSADTRQAQRDLWQKEVRDVFNATLVNTDFFDQWAQEFKESKEVRPEDMTVAVHKVSEEYSFTKMEEEAIMAALMTDRTIFPEDRGTGYALINAMTVASKDMGLEQMHDMAKIAGNVKKVMKVVC